MQVNNSPSIVFPNRIRYLRTMVLGLSQKELSRVSGIERSYLARIERGDIIPSAVKLHDLARALGVLADSLFDRDWSEGRRSAMNARREELPPNHES